MLITKKLLDHLAHLARIELTDGESVRFVKDLNAIFKHLKELDSVDVTGVEPMIAGAGLKNIFRTDTVSLSSKAETVDEEGHIISAFPESRGGRLKVQKIL
ncbi:MAG: Asp-tRNA(Asn)/Glu-tRNA(Gln) amidotransferase subunit GatC [Candidatus Pacebacteria bacterium]|nr:Asp-tRNA(Asn)/Glu-tRNA(Gln) amidotransferase subunit GatC [Candidatus Paceibacterota bacterium]